MSRFTRYYRFNYEDDGIALWRKSENKWQSIVSTNTMVFYMCFPKPLAFEISFEDLI